MKGLNISLVLCLTTSFLVFSNEEANEDNKDELLEPSYIGNNLCTIEGNSAPFHCFCSDGSLTANVTKAKCWLFKGLRPEHKLWSIFATQPLIKELNIMASQMGEFTFIPTAALRHLKELQALTIVYGYIADIHPYAFANLSNIYEIILKRNGIETLSHHSFSRLPNLSVIDLDENRITKLNRNVFTNLPQLKKLFLKENNISSIQDGTFRHLGQLIELELGENNITSIGKNTFAGLGELKKLMLNFNKISILENLAFAELWFLEELELEGNKIEFISDKAFAGLTHVWRLNLSYNKLKTVQGALLNDVPSLINFDLRRNKLDTLTACSVQPILRNFYDGNGYLYLSGNDFICDCRLSWIYTLKNETNSQIIRESMDDLTCHLKDANKNQLPASFSLTSKFESPENVLHEGSKNPSLDPLNLATGEDEYEYYEDYTYQENVQDPTLRFLTQIPVNELPCPDESEFLTEIPENVINTHEYSENNSCNRGYSKNVLLICLFIVAKAKLLT